jgi:hypothetical protein
MSAVSFHREAGGAVDGPGAASAPFTWFDPSWKPGSWFMSRSEVFAPLAFSWLIVTV